MFLSFSGLLINLFYKVTVSDVTSFEAIFQTRSGARTTLTLEVGMRQLVMPCQNFTLVGTPIKNTIDIEVMYSECVSN